MLALSAMPHDNTVEVQSLFLIEGRYIVHFLSANMNELKMQLI